MNIKTLKIPYQISNEDELNCILKLQKQYNSCFNFIYNRLLESKSKLSTKEAFIFFKQMKNVNDIDSYFKNGALYDAKAIIERFKGQKLIFGGKNLFLQRIKHLVSKDEFKLKRLRPLQIVSASTNKGNCKFQIVDENAILFKPDRKHHINLNIKCSKNYRKLLNRLIVHQEQKDLAITYKLDSKFIYLTFDLNKVIKLESINRIRDRICSIDMNPNYVGLSVIDWKSNDEYKLIHKEVISIKELNDFENSLSVNSESKEHKHIANKRHYEIIRVVQHLTNICNHYKCSTFAIEDLNIKSKDRNIRKLNKLCNNQWNRNLFTRVLEKYCNLYSFRLQKICPEYSSFMGNLIYRNERLPDMILASIEISRRCYNFIHQYILKDHLIKKNIIFDDSLESNRRVVQSLEELNCLTDFNDYQELYKKMKMKGDKYRFLLEDSLRLFESVLRNFSMKSMIEYIRFC